MSLNKHPYLDDEFEFYQTRLCCKLDLVVDQQPVVFRFVAGVPGMNAREISKSLSDPKVFHTTTQTINTTRQMTGTH